MEMSCASTKVTGPSSAAANIREFASNDVEQSGPKNDFLYIDISSIDKNSKCISAAKTLKIEDAPNRAKQILKDGDILVSMTRPNLNAVAIVNKEHEGAIGSTGLFVLRTKHLNPKYLYYKVQTNGFIESMSSLVQGALYPAIRPKDIMEYEVEIFSANEQTRIVEKLEELLPQLDAGMAELQAAQKKLTQYRQSLLKAAVEGQLTANW